MGARRWMWARIRRAAVEAIGWTLVVLGVAALFLPGPGILLLFIGTAFLAQHYVWASRIVDYLEGHAIHASRKGVESWWRLSLGFLGGAVLFVIGLIWAYGPTIGVHEISLWGFGPYVLGPEVPMQGWAIGFALMGSGTIAWLILLESVRRFGWPGSAKQQALND